MRVLLDLLLPPACGACGRPGRPLCRTCRIAFVPPSLPADRFVAADAGVLLGDDLTLALAAFAHSGPMRSALAALKYRGVSRLAAPLAEAAAPTLMQMLAITGPATLVPVPVHVERQRERGYNQAQLLAHELAARCGVDCVAMLERVRPTTKQHRLDRAERLANLRSAFSPTVTAGAPPASVVIVDDIVTTAATLEACASVLRAAGVQSVHGFAVAREV